MNEMFPYICNGMSEVRGLFVCSSSSKGLCAVLKKKFKLRIVIFTILMRQKNTNSEIFMLSITE